MKRDNAIKLVRQLQRYRDHACRKPYRKGFFVKQALFPRATRTEYTEAERNVKAHDLRCKHPHAIWVPLDKIKTMQGCLNIRRMVYQLRRHPIKYLPTVVKVGKLYLLWDGHHRAMAAAMLGRVRIRCMEIRERREFT